jgi:hypothetical protein
VQLSSKALRGSRALPGWDWGPAGPEAFSGWDWVGGSGVGHLHKSGCPTIAFQEVRAGPCCSQPFREQDPGLQVPPGFVKGDFCFFSYFLLSVRKKG